MRKDVRSTETNWLGRVIAGTFTLAWRFRTELAVAATPCTCFVFLNRYVSEPIATVITVAAVSLAVGSPKSRQWLGRRLYLASKRRMWEKACGQVEIAGNDCLPPTVVKATRTAAGDRLLVRAHRGGSVEDLERNAERLAAALCAREVRVVRDDANAAFAHVSVARRDPLDAPVPLAWPNADEISLSLWEPIPVGIDSDGAPVNISLPERNVLIGGEPGAGKSVVLSMLVATAALDPNAKLWIFDGKQVELAAWSGVAEKFVGPSIVDANNELRALRDEMNARYARLLAAQQRKVLPNMEEMPLVMVVCDELAFYLTIGARKQREEFADLLRDLVARGRAAGIIVVAATQKPSHDLVPTNIRDLFGFRWALRCNTPQASDTILGSWWSSLGFDASTVAGHQRGVGYLFAEESEPVRMLGYCLADDDIRRVAARAVEIRSTQEVCDEAA